MVRGDVLPPKVKKFKLRGLHVFLFNYLFSFAVAMQQNRVFFQSQADVPQRLGLGQSTSLYHGLAGQPAAESTFWMKSGLRLDYLVLLCFAFWVICLF